MFRGIFMTDNVNNGKINRRNFLKIISGVFAGLMTFTLGIPVHPHDDQYEEDGNRKLHPRPLCAEAEQIEEADTGETDIPEQQYPHHGALNTLLRIPESNFDPEPHAVDPTHHVTCAIGAGDCGFHEFLVRC